MFTKKTLCVILYLSIFLGFCFFAMAHSVPIDAEEQSQQIKEEDNLKEWNNQIRRDKFDIVLPEAMRKNSVDMWIHVMREKISDPFGAEELGSTSGVFVFTDRGSGRIERAILGRRWGVSHRGYVEWDTKLVEECDAYDIIGDSVRVQQPVGGPETEYDYRFKGLREFVEEHDPKRIALNFKKELGPFPTTRAKDGISYTDYLLLAEEVGDKYAKRIVSSEYVMMDYIINKVPSEIKLLKKISMERAERAKKIFAEIEPGVTKARGAGFTVFRRMSTGQSQRGRSDGWENAVVQGGDIVAAPSQGMYAYVLREGEAEPPPEIQRLWAKYLKIDKILAETIRAGLTAREIKENYKRRFEEEGIIVRDDQLHMVVPKNNFPFYSAGFDAKKTHLSIDCHGMMKGARKRPEENYFGPRIGSQGPEWTWNIPLPPHHHFVLEYFFYMPSPGPEGKDQYLFFWDHEQAIATENGVVYLSPPQKELYLIE
jgi:hypothetical protein